MCCWFSPISVTTLEALQCHFTWALDFRHNSFPQLRQHLEDINPQEGNRWLGSVHNLLGFISFQLKANEDALQSFMMAAEAFRGRAADEGPCLVVTYGNLAWLYHHLGEGEESQTYLSRVGVLMRTHPPPSQDELHPEVYAEKAWTLMNIAVHYKQAGPYFLRAIERRPDMVAWNSSYMVWIIKSHGKELGEELVEDLRSAKERDPENSYLAVHYLNQRAKRGEDFEEEARMLADRIMEAPVGKYSGMKALLWIFTQYISANEAMKLADTLLNEYPDQQYSLNCAAQCYRWSLSSESIRAHHESLKKVRDRAIVLHLDLIKRCPDISAHTKLHLADIYALTDLRRAEQLFKDLLGNPNPYMRQKIYHKYANFLYYHKHDGRSSACYHMAVLRIPQQSSYRTKSYNILDKKRKKKLFPHLKLEQFLNGIPPPENGPDAQRDDRA